MLRRRTLFDTHILEAVAERDIDLLVLEELTVSREFAEWFFLENNLALPIQNSARAFHSVSDAELGESDIVVLYENGHAILVENKIGAIAQKNQAKRYRQRGEKGLLCKSWSSYSTCIIAPNNYLERTADARGYQTHISYERIRDWFGSHNTERHQFKRNLMHEAIEQNRRGYTNIPDARVTAFWKDYWDLATRDYPNLGMYQPGNKPANSSFIYFHPEALPGKFQLIHKVDHGFVDLQVPGMAPMIDKVTEIFSDLEIEIAVAGNSVVFRKQIQKMDISRSFREQEHLADTALHNAQELAAITQEIWQRLSQNENRKIR
jgi:hypothetical protein